MRIEHRGAILALLVFIMGSSGAFACVEPNPPTAPERFERAHEVFVARVVSIELKRVAHADCEEEECEYVRAKYVLVEPVKGTPKRRGTIDTNIFSMCGENVLVGWYHLFYIGKNGEVQHVFMIETDEITEEDLAELRQMRKYPHELPNLLM